MIVSNWYIRVTNDNDIVVCSGNVTYPLKADEVQLSNRGFSFKLGNISMECNFDNMHSKKHPTILKRINREVKVTPTVPFFIYEVISGVIESRNYALVNPIPFDFEALKNKYSDCLKEYDTKMLSSFMFELSRGVCM